MLNGTLDAITSAGKVEQVHIFKYSDDTLIQLIKSEAASGQISTDCFVDAKEYCVVVDISCFIL